MVVIEKLLSFLEGVYTVDYNENNCYPVGVHQKCRQCKVEYCQYKPNTINKIPFI